MSDRTHRGSDSGKAYSEYYAPDGTLRGKSDTESYTGSWKVVGEQLCFDYSYADTSKNYSECYDVYNNGDMIQWVDANGVQQETVFVPGNPDGL